MGIERLRGTALSTLIVMLPPAIVLISRLLAAEAEGISIDGPLGVLFVFLPPVCVSVAWIMALHHAHAPKLFNLRNRVRGKRQDWCLDTGKKMCGKKMKTERDLLSLARTKKTKTERDLSFCRTFFCR